MRDILEYERKNKTNNTLIFFFEVLNEKTIMIEEAISQKTL